MRYLKRVFLAVLVLIFVLVGCVFLYSEWLKFQSSRYYQARLLLQAMSEAHNGRFTNNSSPARDALLKRLPLGTSREISIATLSAEGFGCQKSSGTLGRFVNPVTEIDCQLDAPARGLGSTKWIIGLEFDKSDQLRDAKVAIWNIFL